MIKDRRSAVGLICRSDLLLLRWRAITFPLTIFISNTIYNFGKYYLQFLQILFAITTNTLSKSAVIYYSSDGGPSLFLLLSSYQIQFIILTNASCIFYQYFFAIYANTLGNLKNNALIYCPSDAITSPL